MATITFSTGKQKIAEFAAEHLEFERQPDGLMLSAQGEMMFQDTPLLENVANHSSRCCVTIEKDGQAVIDQPFEVTFFTLDADALVALLR